MMSETHEYELRMMDFSPLAVTNRWGLGQVVKERTTIVQSGSNSKWHEKSGDQQCLTIETSLPYVEVGRSVVGGCRMHGWITI